MIDFLVELRSLLYFYINYYRCKLKGGYIAHHGIQRSGTNYLNQWLKLAGCNVINSYDPRRNDPRHKHFRWQHNKATIVLDKQYNNDVRIDTLTELNAVCGYAVGTKHIVIYREPSSWMNGIYKWGLRSGWLSSSMSTQDLYVFLKSAMTEWVDYYLFWSHIRAENQEYVFILGHSDVVGGRNDKIGEFLAFMNLDINFTDVEVLDVPKSRGGISEIDSDLLSVVEKVLYEMQKDCSFRELAARLGMPC